MFFFDEPATRGANGAGSADFTFEKKGSTVAHLCHGRVDAEVPYRRSDEVGSRTKERSQVESFVAPVREIAAGRSVAHTMAVHKQNKSVICAHARGVAGGNGAQLERAPEVQDKRLAQGSCRMRNPSGLPLTMG